MKTKRYHFIIDMEYVSQEILNDEKGLDDFLRRLPGLINMTVLEGPVTHCGIPENPGLSGFVIIDYSHISIHTFTKYSEALVDIFSCKPYDQDATIQLVLDYFKAERSAATIQQVSWA